MTEEWHTLVIPQILDNVMGSIRIGAGEAVVFLFVLFGEGNNVLVGVANEVLVVLFVPADELGRHTGFKEEVGKRFVILHLGQWPWREADTRKISLFMMERSRGSFKIYKLQREDDENYLIRRILSRNGHGTHLDMRVRLRRHTTKESECSLIAGLW